NTLERNFGARLFNYHDVAALKKWVCCFPGLNVIEVEDFVLYMLILRSRDVHALRIGNLRYTSSPGDTLGKRGAAVIAQHQRLLNLSANCYPLAVCFDR